MQPVTFPADVVNNAVVGAGLFAITINFHDGRAAFDDVRKSDSCRFHGRFWCLSARTLSEKCPTSQAKSFIPGRFDSENHWQRVRESNPCTSLERAVS